MAENQKSRGKGLQYFSRFQLVLLATGFAATTFVIFLLGILIGQVIEERKLERHEEPLVRVPLQPRAQGSKGSQAAPGKDEMTFYDTLARAPSTEAQPSKENKPAEKAVKGGKAEEKAAKKAVQEAKTAAQKEPAETAQKSQVKEKAEPEKTAAAPESKKPAEEQKSPEAASAKNETPAQEGVWTVQVNAFPDQRSAQRLVERLKAKGYDSYLVPTNIKGRDWYRVRVGRFATREEAKALQENLQTKENFTKAITVSR